MMSADWSTEPETSVESVSAFSPGIRCAASESTSRVVRSRWKVSRFRCTVLTSVLAKTDVAGW